MSDLGDKAAQIAIAESKRNDIDEVTDNRGPRIDQYLDNAGFLPKDPTEIGKAWCGMFVYWCYRQVAKELNVLNPLPRATFGGGGLSTWANAHDNWIIYRAGDSEPTLDPG